VRLREFIVTAKCLLRRLLGLAGGRQQTVELLELVIRQVFERIWDFLGVLRQERCYEPHVRGRVLLAMSADAAAKKKDPAMAQHQAECQTQAKKKYSAIHFLKRHAFVKSCMTQKA